MSVNYGRDFIYGLKAGRELFTDAPRRARHENQTMQMRQQQHNRAGEQQQWAREDRQFEGEQREAFEASRVLRSGLFDTEGHKKEEFTDADKAAVLQALNSRPFQQWRERHGIAGQIQDGGIAEDGNVWMAFDKGDGQLAGYVVGAEDFRDDVTHESIRISPEFSDLQQQAQARRQEQQDIQNMRGGGAQAQPQRQQGERPELADGAPRSFRNNNPGNIRGQFHGAVGNEGGFAVYDSPQAGWDAMERQLFRYANGDTTGKELRSVSDIVNTWSPAEGEGNTKESTDNYVEFVANRLGVDPDRPLDLTDEATRRELMSAMATREAGVETPYGSDFSGEQVQAGTGLGREEELQVEEIPETPSEEQTARLEGLGGQIQGIGGDVPSGAQTQQVLDAGVEQEEEDRYGGLGRAREGFRQGDIAQGVGGLASAGVEFVGRQVGNLAEASDERPGAALSLLQKGREGFQRGFSGEAEGAEAEAADQATQGEAPQDRAAQIIEKAGTSQAQAGSNAPFRVDSEGRGLSSGSGGPEQRQRPSAGQMPGGGQMMVTEQQAQSADRLFQSGKITAAQWERFHETGRLQESGRWQNMGGGIWQTPWGSIVSERQVQAYVGMPPEEMSVGDQRALQNLLKETDQQIADLAGIDMDAPGAGRRMQQINLAILAQGRKPADFVQDQQGGRELLRAVGPIQNWLNNEENSGFVRKIFGGGRKTEHRTATMAFQIALSGGTRETVREHAQQIRQRYHDPLQQAAGNLDPEQLDTYSNAIIAMERVYGEPLETAQQVVIAVGEANNWHPESMDVFLRDYAEALAVEDQGEADEQGLR